MSHTLDQAAIDHLARLTQLTLNHDEAKTIAAQFAQTLDYIENLGELDTSRVSQSTHISGLTNVLFEDGKKNERLLDVSQNTKSTDVSGRRYFVVEKIL
jgi:aspartyl/glutamyl-tRNA(Asn/Gln) amidotransferase C subunit